MKRFATVAVAALLASMTARAALAQSTSVPATTAQAQAADLVLMQALVWQQWYVLGALSVYANRPNATPEEVEAARKAWFTNGAGVMTVPSTGPAAQWFTAGGDVLSGAPSANASAIALNAAARTADAAVDAGDAEAPVPDAQPVVVELDAGAAAVDAGATASSEGEPWSFDAGAFAFAAPAPPPTSTPSSSTSSSPSEQTTSPTSEARSTRLATPRWESREWLVAPACFVFALFTSLLIIAHRARTTR
jgi:hypothetical protein